MSHLSVLKEPTKSLREKSAPVDPARLQDPEFQKLLDDMIETMKVEDGVGIAGPQIGINERIIIVDTGNGAGAYINPEITKKSFRKIESEEGCLSVPGVFGIVKRHKKCVVKALDREGNELRLDLTGFPAIVFQHEIDHLDGTLFIDKVERFTTHPKL